MTFYVGQKVVCVDDAERDEYTPWPLGDDDSLHGLTKGVVYNVRAIGKYGGVLTVYLAEIIRPIPTGCSKECGYALERFRPLVERKTSIEIFTRMLSPKQGVDA